MCFVDFLGLENVRGDKADREGNQWKRGRHYTYIPEAHQQYWRRKTKVVFHF